MRVLKSLAFGQAEYLSTYVEGSPLGDKVMRVL